MKETRRSFLTSCTALLLCFSMLLGSTFAWFTDVVTSSGNKIVTGSLDLDLQLKDKETGSYSSINESSDPLFNYDKWEPGYTDIKVLKVANVGSLSFKWVGNFVSRETITKLAEVIDVYVKTSEADFAYPTEMTEITSANGWKNIGTLDKIIDSPTQPVSGQLLSGESDYFAVALHMQESAGNEYQDTTLGAFDIAVHAAQYTAENDSFGNDYDENAQWPSGVIAGTITASGAVATDEQGKVASEITLTSSDGKVSALLPAGTQLEAGKTNVTVIVSPVHESQANVTLGDTEKMLPVDVHIDGVAENNDVPIPVYLAEWMAVGLNIGNYHLYHVENGATNEMTLRQGSATPVHNNFDYDPATGDVTLYLASFSEVAMVADIENAWDGAMDFSWYTNASANTTTYQIANADQLAAFGAIVGGMAKDKDGEFLITYTDSDGDEHHNDNFSGKTVKLLADVNLGDKESENKSDIIFYPIGYWNSDGTYEKTGTAISSGFYAFEGTFDGNGNTVSNFYQNTWEMKGDHDWYDATLQYYRDGMGLFGKVYGGTVKNLTVNNFSCDSEIGTSGVIAAYADSKNGIPAVFENITITNCNPRVYNIGNGGIVGCAGWYSRNESLGDENYTNAVTFRNITVDQTNKISALWGSWGVSCAGILGQYYPNSSCGIKLENCHVAAIIDVNNDVCSNYQYYWYRYAGMFIGTIRANTTDANGYTVADTTGVTAKDCTYTMGNWNEYWYCEIVANSLASYTHDHQFSRLDNIYALSEIKDEQGNWNKEGHFALLDENRDIVDCYHIFKDSEGNLYRHFHDVADESNPNIYESFDLNGDGELNDLKEDRQRYFIPFNQLLTGLDMGIKAHTEFEGINFVENGTVKSEEKFESLGTVTTYRPGQTITLGHLVNSIVDDTKLSKASIYAAVSPATENDNVSATYSLNLDDWKNSTITFAEDSTGSAKIVITDYFYCTATVIYLNPEQAAEKFTANSIPAQSAYTQITLGDIFGVKDGATIGNVTATVTDPNGTETTLTGTASDWATKTIDLTKDGTWTIDIKDDDAYCSVTTASFTVNAIDKFQANNNLSFEHTLENGTINVTLGEIFTAIDASKINSASVNVQVTNNGTECEYIKNENDWTQSALTFKGKGSVTITISDDNACNTATATLTITEPAEKDVFTKKFTNTNFIYRVGNGNNVNLSSLFSATGLTSGAEVSIEFDVKSGNVVANYTANISNWSNGSIKFTGTGVVVVTIDSNAFTKSVELKLEVVDAVNATSATSATSNNVVLLNDCGFSSLEVSGGYALYGNGFTMTCGSDSAALDMGYAFVTLNDGTLDNVQIVCPNFDYAVLYKSNMTESGNRKETTDKTRYFNVKSGVMVSGNSQILNSRISGGRAAVYATNGNLVIDNSQIELGAAANIHVGASLAELTLKDVTLIQNPTKATVGDTSKTLMGVSVIVMANNEGKSTPITIEGEFNQYAWAHEGYSSYVPEKGKSLVSTVMAQENYIHSVKYDDNTYGSINLGIIFMPEDTIAVKQPTVTDNRDNTPYSFVNISNMSWIYTVGNSNIVNNLDVDTDMTNIPNYISTTQGDTLPLVEYSDTNENRVLSSTYNVDKGWIYKLSVNLDNGAYTFKFANLVITKAGVAYSYTLPAGVSNTIQVEEGTTEYVLTAIIDGVEHEVYFQLIGTASSKEAPKWSNDANGTTLSTSMNANWAYGVCVATSNGGTWSGAAPALSNVYIRYYSTEAKAYKVINLADYTPTTKGKLNGTNQTYTIEGPDFTLTLTGGQVHSSNKVNAMPVVVQDGSTYTLYFVASASNGLVNSGNSARTVPVSYSFTDGLGNTLTGSHTWSVAEVKDGAYSYSKFCEGTLEANTCVTPDTLITLADGTQVRVDSLKGDEMLLVWNLETGKFDKAPIMFVDSDAEAEYEIVHLYFSDGTDVKVIYEHGFWDYDLNKYVYLDRYADKYIGHTFAKQNGDKLEKVQLTDVVIETEVTTAWSPVTVGHLCYFVNGMLSMPGGVGGLFNIFEVDAETMTYDYEQLAKDIETYGLFTYEELNAICPLSEEMFNAAGGAYLKISIGKGNLTIDELINMINRYSKFI